MTPFSLNERFVLLDDLETMAPGEELGQAQGPLMLMLVATQAGPQVVTVDCCQVFSQADVTELLRTAYESRKRGWNVASLSPEGEAHLQKLEAVSSEAEAEPAAQEHQGPGLTGKHDKGDSA